MLKAAVSEDWIHQRVQSFVDKNKDPGGPTPFTPSGTTPGAHARLRAVGGRSAEKTIRRTLAGQDPHGPLPGALPARKQYALTKATTDASLGMPSTKHYGPGWSNASDKLRSLQQSLSQPVHIDPLPAAPRGGMSPLAKGLAIGVPLAAGAAYLYHRHKKNQKPQEKTAHDVLLMALADELEKIALLKDDPSLDDLCKEAIFGNVGRGLAAIGRGIKSEATQLGSHVGQEIAQQAGRPMNPMMPVANLPGYAAGAGKYIASKFGKGHLGEAAGTIAEHAVHPSAAGIKPALTHGIEGAMHGMGALGHLAAPVVAPAAASLAAGGAGGLFKRFAGRAGHAAGHALHTVVG